VNQLKTAAIAQGYTTAAQVATSTLNLVVEMALGQLNATAAK
jgi:hypothetical protein